MTAVDEAWMVPLVNLRDDSRAVAGGKAASLGRLLQAGLPVPAGFCITAAAFSQWLRACPTADGLIDRLDACLSAIAHQSMEKGSRVEELSQVGAELRRVLASTPLPESVAQAVMAAAQSGEVRPPWAVRSSATDEDQARASFAGQHDTVLDVREGPALLDAIRQGWLSLFSERALSYRRRHGLPIRPAAMAVIVQEMVRADLSGLLFTADPLTGRSDRLVVEHTAGPGLALVQGTLRPRRVIVDRATGRAVTATPAEAGDELPRAVLESLVDLARQAEARLGGPQDIEWAQEAGRIVVLQSRPITTRLRAANDTGSVWSNMNTVENLPNVATPMTWSFMNTCFHAIGDSLFRCFGIDPEQQPALGLVAGRIYLNVTVIRRIISCTPGLRGVSSASLFGGYQDGEAGGEDQVTPAQPSTDTTAPRARLRLGALCRFAWQRGSCRSRRWYLKHLSRTLDRFVNVDCRALSDREAVAHFRRLLDYGLLHLRFPLMLGPGLVAGVALRQFTARWLDDPEGTLASQLMSQAGGMASADAPLELWQLALWIAGDARLRKAVLEADSFDRLQEGLGSTPAGRAFLEHWGGFMERHGHRANGEVDLAAPRWSENPDELLGRVRHYLRHAAGNDLLGRFADRSRERDRRLAESQARLAGPFRRWMLDLLVREAQAGLVFRENLKDELVRAVAFLRRLLLELGERLARAGVLEQREDIFFLTVEELEPVVSRTATLDVRLAVNTRRAQHRANEALSPPPVIVDALDPEWRPLPIFDPSATVLCGLPVSSGKVVGPARVILSAASAESVLPGEILVAPYTDPGWTPHFLTAAGLVTDLGGQLSHGSVVAREYGLPAVVNVPFATRTLRTGQRICVDGDRGRVTILPPAV